MGFTFVFLKSLFNLRELNIFSSYVFGCIVVGLWYYFNVLLNDNLISLGVLFWYSFDHLKYVHCL